MVRLLIVTAALSVAAPVFAEDQETRSRKVKVALALAGIDAPKSAPVVAAKPAVKLDWFGDEPKAPAVAAKNVPCVCGPDCKCAAGTCPNGCPAKAAPAAPAAVSYRVEKQCQQWYDARGYLHSQCVDVLVAVPAAVPAQGK